MLHLLPSLLLNGCVIYITSFGARCFRPNGFTIIGCQIALQMGHGFVVSAVAGVLTGVSGGIYVTSYVTTSRLSSAVSCMRVFLCCSHLLLGLSRLRFEFRTYRYFNLSIRFYASFNCHLFWFRNA